MDKLFEILSEYSEVSPENINEQTKIVEDLGLDSFALLSMIVDIENEYGIDLQNQDLSTFKTWGDLIKFLQENKKIS